MPPVEFEPTISAGERPQTYALDRAATGTGIYIYHHHHHHLSVMELRHLLTRSGLTYPEVSSEVCHDSFCQLGNSVSLPWVIFYGTFYLHVVSSFSCIPVIRLKLVLFLIALQFCVFVL